MPAEHEYTKIAIGDIGTQLFWFKKAESDAESKFEYALPVTAGAEFGGDTETFDAPETDLDYVPKIGGRTSLSDISYTINYTKEKYARIEEITDRTNPHIYMEVFQDGSAAIFSGTSGLPSITAGDVRQITMNIAPDFLCVISNIYDLDEDTDIKKLDALVADDFIGNTENKYSLYTTSDSKKIIKIDKTTIPAQRQEYYTTKNSPA